MGQVHLSAPGSPPHPSFALRQGRLFSLGFQVQSSGIWTASGHAWGQALLAPHPSCLPGPFRRAMLQDLTSRSCNDLTERFPPPCRMSSVRADEFSVTENSDSANLTPALLPDRVLGKDDEAGSQ